MIPSLKIFLIVLRHVNDELEIIEPVEQLVIVQVVSFDLILYQAILEKLLIAPQRKEIVYTGYLKINLQLIQISFVSENKTFL